MTHLFLSCWGLLLAAYDLKEHAYPLGLWLIPTMGLLIFYPPNPLSIFLLGLALLALIKDLRIGSGDLFFLASLALVISFQNLLWLIQLASLAGLITLYLRGKGNRPLAFIPCLVVAYLFLLWLGWLN